MTAKRTRKLFRREMFALILNDSGHVIDIEETEDAAAFFMQEDSRVIPVLVSEIPKPSPRKKVKR